VIPLITYGKKRGNVIEEIQSGGERMRKKAQSMTEYAVLIAVFLAAVIIAQRYVKQAISGRFKSSADSISTEHFGANYTSNSWDQASSNETTGSSDAIGSGYWSESQLVDSGLGLESEIDLNYKGGQVSKKDWGINYNLKGNESDIWSE